MTRDSEGSRTVKTVISAGTLAAVIVPPWASTSWRVMARPRPLVPLPAVLGGLAGALLIGMVAGVYPSVRAARLAPAEALAAP
jgi:putative ABC transport system permease protein